MFAAQNIDGRLPSDWRVLGLATLAIAGLELVVPIVTLQFYDRVLPNASYSTMATLIIGAGVALLLDAILKISRVRIMNFSGSVMAHSLSQAIFERFLDADPAKLPEDGAGKRLNAFASARSIASVRNGYAFTVALEFCLSPILIVMIAVIGGSLALAPAVLVLLFIAVTLRNGKDLKSSFIERRNVDDARYDFIVETLNAAHSVKALSLEEPLSRRYEALKYDASVENHRVAESLSKIFDASAFFASLITMATTVFGAWLALRGEISTGALIACVLLAGRVMGPVQRALALYARWQDYLVAREDVESFLNIPQARSPSARPRSAAPIEKLGELDVKNMGFELSDGRALFSDVSFSAKPGDVVQIAGEPGAGKTTFMKLVAGLYLPTRGEIRVDGTQVQDFEAHELTRHVGYMPTAGVIYRGTVLDNMSRFAETSTEDVMYVAGLLGVDRDVASLPGGFDTPLTGGAADPISQGLRQRIALVRALAPRPKILLFDNADTSLDQRSYQLVFELISKLRKKVAFVMHSDDEYLLSFATRRVTITGSTFVEAPLERSDAPKVRRYRELRV